MAVITSCNNSRVVDVANPLLESEWDTPFGIVPFERVEAKHYLEAFDLAFEELRSDIKYIVEDDAPASFESVIWRLDNSGQRLKDLKDLFEMSEAAISDENYRAVSEKLTPMITAIEDSVLMNEALFERVKTIYDMRDELDLNSDQKRLAEKCYTKFVRGGANLNAKDKSRLAEINGEIASLSSKFSQNLLVENETFYLSLEANQLEGIPQTLREIAKDEANSRGLGSRWVFTLNPSSMIPFLTYSKKRDLREQLYTAYVKRGANGGDSDNSEIVKRVTQLRQERAVMLGYENHADYVISQQMAGNVSDVNRFLNSIWNPALRAAKGERSELQKLLREELGAQETLKSWDWWYYTERLRSNKYKLESSSLSPFLSLETVRGGAFTLANRLYGLAFRPIDVPLYHEDCVAYEVLDRDNSHLGVLYFDLYPRSGKGQGAWCGNLREQRVDGGDRITPVVAVVCNFPRPISSSPSLLSVDQVETLFHEFGHALHFIFQNVDYRGLAAVEGDFVEFPSQVMENWAMEPEFLQMYATHYRTGKPMDKLLINRIISSKNFNQGYETVSVLAAAFLDLELQKRLDFAEFDIAEFEKNTLLQQKGLIPEIEPRYHLTNFAHLFTYDYSAGYYFYMWSEVLDKDCFAAFKESGSLFSKSVADRLRKEILERGGEEDGATLYRNFRGADPSNDHLLRSRGWID